jgi:protein-disulfide isomerase
MKISILKVSLAILTFYTLSLSQMPAYGQSPTTEQIIKQLETSGALDKAIDRGIERYRQKQLNAAKVRQEKEDAEKAALAKNARAVDINNDFIYGKPDAIISIIEYSDFECPFCKQFGDIPIQVVDAMPNQVNLVWRNFPLPFHDPVASKEAIAAVCAAQQGGNDAFWKFARSIFESTRSNGQGMPSEKGSDAIEALAKKQGLQIGQFNTCINSEAVKKQVQADLEDGANAGINGTPGIILINHKTGRFNVLAGAVPVEALKQEVSNLLKNKQ